MKQNNSQMMTTYRVPRFIILNMPMVLMVSPVTNSPESFIKKQSV